jgi:hypothetical protein
MTQLLLDDLELGEDLTPNRLGAAERDCVARTIRVATGAWRPETNSPQIRHGIGLLVLDGLLTRRVGLDGRYGAELLGAGDLLRPWQPEDAALALSATGDWRILRPCRFAVLDVAFTARVARYPEVVSALFSRAIRRSRRLATSMAIVHQTRIEVRLHMLLWELADRWGTVGPDGVRVPIRLTHQVLSELVAAHRPSVTKALGELAEDNLARWDGQAWILSGPRPSELAEVLPATTDG